jgi:HD-GYP domain-containing protein (c-di-GMP phosphodiesterase class II)
MVSDRPYRRGLTENEIIEELQRCSGKQFDPLVVKAFSQILEKSEKEVVINSARKVEAKHHVPSVHPVVPVPGATLPP